MTKTIGALEKEVGLWKARYEKASMTLLDVTEEVRVYRYMLEPPRN